MRRGDDVIYQATFFDGRWLGFADFLLRVETPSALGPWSYEVADTKLARHTKASALLQMCSYIEQLGADPGRSSPSGCTSRSAAAPGTWTATASRTTWPTTGRSSRLFEDRIAGDRPGLPARRHVPRARRALRRLPLGRAVRRPATR